MAEINRTALFGKLNELGYKALESATVLCKMRGNPYVELAHWIQQILQLPDSDLHRIVRNFEINPSRLAADLTRALDALPRGATAIMDFSPHLEETVERGWVYGSLLFGDHKVRSGHLVVGLLKTSALKHVLLNISGEFAKIKLEALTDRFADLVGGSPEDALAAHDGSGAGEAAATGGEPGAASAPAAMGRQEALKKYAVDLTERARRGDLDPILGRDDEVRQMVDILMRRRQNNPILTGEAGVGKTAVVEGFAQRIATGDVPPPLQNVAVLTLDLGLLQAGASMKGEFENRLRQIIEEVQSSPEPIILFIDEAHTLIGAGGAAGSGDAANLLKPALARGTLRTIAATTWAEYKKYIEKDPALTRRFQVVKVEEPSEAKAVLMLRGLAAAQEKHHRVQILDEALETAVQLSHRYIPDRQLPDKAVSLLDTACARVAVGQYAVPAAVEDVRRRIDALKTEQDILDREENVGMEHAARRKTIQAELKTLEKDRARRESDWEKEKKLVARILELRAALRNEEQTADAPAPALAETAPAAPDGATAPAEAPAPTTAPTAAERGKMLTELKKRQAELEKIQGETPLILPCVTAQAVASVVADWTGIPVGRMVKNEIAAVLKLADTLEQRVIGQRHALEAIARRIRTSRARLDNPGRPIGVFLLAGPSGVGKTETALALADVLYGGEQNVITINMSEFQEAHTVSTLKGAPPGYVGYGEGGILTEAVRRRPYSIVLLDEVEKAHSDVHEIFFQVFDKGMMEDGEGRLIDFKNTIILLTSNVGSDLIMNLCKDPDLKPEPEGVAQALRAPLLKVFPAALLGRVVVVPYNPIDDAMLQAIIRLQLKRIERRILENHAVPFTYDDGVIRRIAERCTEQESGARAVDAVLTHHLLPAISGEFLTRLAEGRKIARVHVAEKDGTLAYQFE
jgi:type VI secretion system protein VasG